MPVQQSEKWWRARFKDTYGKDATVLELESFMRDSYLIRKPWDDRQTHYRKPYDPKTWNNPR